MTETKPTSASCKAYTETEQEIAKEFLGDFFCRYLTQVEEDITNHEFILKHKVDVQSPAFLELTKKRIAHSKHEKQMICFAVDFLKQKGAI